jgi:hypothetical protein
VARRHDGQPSDRRMNLASPGLFFTRSCGHYRANSRSQKYRDAAAKEALQTDHRDVRSTMIGVADLYDRLAETPNAAAATFLPLIEYLPRSTAAKAAASPGSTRHCQGAIARPVARRLPYSHARNSALAFRLSDRRTVSLSTVPRNPCLDEEGRADRRRITLTSP